MLTSTQVELSSVRKTGHSGHSLPVGAGEGADAARAARSDDSVRPASRKQLAHEHGATSDGSSVAVVAGFGESADRVPTIWHRHIPGGTSSVSPTTMARKLRKRQLASEGMGLPHSDQSYRHPRSAVNAA